jgi:spermidine/putrescine ABC transporter ATP-binding subunit
VSAYLELVALSKRFGSSLVVDSVSLQMGKGELLTLLGPSGCGKTTTLRMIAGFEMPTSGDIYIKGERVNDKPPYRRNTAMVFQSYALFPHMTIFKNVAFGLEMRKESRQNIGQRVGHALDLVQLRGFEDRYPRQLSGGQQQRVALARALAVEPDILLLDEPLSNIDQKLRQQMRLEIKAIQRRLGITTVYVTHDQGEALVISDRLAVMNKGRIVQAGSPSEVYESPRSRFVADFIGEANLITGTVLKSNKTRVEVGIGDGQVVFALPDPEKSVREKERVLVSIRPERIQISKTGLGERNSLVGTVEEVIYIGSNVRYHIGLGKSIMVVDKQVISLDTLHQVGDKVVVEWSEANAILVPAE